MDEKQVDQKEDLLWKQEILEIEGIEEMLETAGEEEAESGLDVNQEPEAAQVNSDNEAIVEAVLFTMGQSVELRQLAAALEADEKTARTAVLSLQRRYQRENRGMQIIELEQSYQMSTRAEFYEHLIKVAATPKKQVLTEVVLETLSIIAYKQPVTKAEIGKIRGVTSDHAVNRLVEYGLVYEVGRLDAPGRPALFATTEEFLRRFGVGTLTDLPTIRPEQAEEIKAEVEEELQWKEEAQPQLVEGDAGDAAEVDMEELDEANIASSEAGLDAAIVEAAAASEE